MGLKLGRLFKKVVKTGIPLVGGFLTGGPMGAGMAGLGLLQAKAGRLSQQIGAGVPSIEAITGVPALRFANGGNGGVQPVAAGAPAVVGALGIRLMTANIARAILKLATILGIPVALPSLVRVGSRLWRTMMTFARRHPAISILSMLTALGLTIEEAGEFLVWGQSKARRRRGRGISARDIRIARRTIRKVAAFQRDLVGLHRHRGRPRGRDGVVVARAG